jgi:type II secretory pathway component PulF
MLSSITGGLQRFQHAGLEGIQAWFAETQFRYSAKQRADLLEVFHSQAGTVDIGTAVKTLQAQFAKTGRPLAGMFKRWSVGMMEGRKFSEVIKGSFSEVELMIIDAGERSGHLASAFGEAAAVARANAEILGTVAKEGAMPATYLAMAVYISVEFSTRLMPSLMKGVAIETLASSQRDFLAATTVVANYWIPATSALGLGLAWSLWSLPRLTGRVRRDYLDRLPPWSIYKSFASSSLMISLSALVKSGQPLDEAVKHMRRMSGPWMHERLGVIVARMKDQKAGAALDVGLFDQQTADLIAIYSATPDFDDALSRIGKRAIVNAVARIKTQLALVRNGSLLLMGLLVYNAYDVVTSVADAGTKGRPATSHRAGR